MAYKINVGDDVAMSGRIWHVDEVWGDEDDPSFFASDQNGESEEFTLGDCDHVYGGVEG